MLYHTLHFYGKCIKSFLELILRHCMAEKTKFMVLYYLHSQWTSVLNNLFLSDETTRDWKLYYVAFMRINQLLSLQSRLQTLSISESFCLGCSNPPQVKDIWSITGDELLTSEPGIGQMICYFKFQPGKAQVRIRGMNVFNRFFAHS